MRILEWRVMYSQIWVGNKSLGIGKVLVLKGRPAYADEIKKLASVSMPVKCGKIKLQLCQ